MYAAGRSSGRTFPDTMPQTVGPSRMVVPVMPPAGPEGVELELDDLFIEDVQPRRALPEGAAGDRRAGDDGAIRPADRGIVTRR
jgi:hypothetical protein